jgi:hypothetical protein
MPKCRMPFGERRDAMCTLSIDGCPILVFSHSRRVVLDLVAGRRALMQVGEVLAMHEIGAHGPEGKEGEMFLAG